MNFKTNTTYLPDEFTFYKHVKLKENDPIKKMLFKFNELSYIFKRIEKFPVDLEELFKFSRSTGKDSLYIYLFKNYIKSKGCLVNSEILEDDLKYIKKFINQFFNYENPIKSNETLNYAWIYPKNDIQKFLANCLFNHNFKDIFYDKITLNKFLHIISEFSKYEYENINSYSQESFNDINYPTLILANVGLYEKGFIEIIDGYDSIEIELNTNGSNCSYPIFTQHDNLLKNNILKVINKKEGKCYTMNDFL